MCWQNYAFPQSLITDLQFNLNCAYPEPEQKYWNRIFNLHFSCLIFGFLKNLSYFCANEAHHIHHSTTTGLYNTSSEREP